MNLVDYKAAMRAADLGLRTFGNQEKHGPVVNVDISAHCDWVAIRFYKNGWSTNIDPTVDIICHNGMQMSLADKLGDALDYIEGEIKAWEALNGRE